MSDKEQNNEEIHALIRELANLNIELNSKSMISNIQLVLKGIEDERDLIIETILSDEDFISFTEKQHKSIAYYYEKDSDDFRLIVIKILNSLLKDYKLFENVDDPKGNLLTYCFIQPINNTYPNRIWAIFQRYYDKFEEMQGNKLLEPMFIHQTYCADDLDFNYSNKYYVDFHEYGVSGRDDRSIINDECEEDTSDTHIDEVQVNEGGTDEEYQKWVTNDVIVIRKYDIPYKKIREDNITLNDEEYNYEINKIRKRILNRWYKYKKLTAVYPNDIFRYRPGHNDFNLREDSISKKQEKIYAYCIEGKEYFNNIVFNKEYQTFIKNVIFRVLSKRERLLIENLYYKLMPAEKVIDLMGFKSKKALDTEKSECLGKIKRQLIKDYKFILEEYNETSLAYWLKKIVKKYKKEIAEKEGKVLSI